MPKKETDLLRDPVSSAQLRFREQVEAFKTQYIPKPKRNSLGDLALKYGLDVNELRK
jgi:hypothetical protein